MWGTFPQRMTKYNLRHGHLLEIPRARNKLGLNSIDFRAGLAWNNISAAVKNADTLSGFINALKNIRIYCSCKCCS